jgi:Trypsin-like peptidase domain
MREGFVVRVLRAGSVVAAGVGFVVGDRHVLTCAHVVNTALGRAQRDRETPGEDVRVQVDFPALGGPEGAPLRSCRVERWSPPPVSGVVGGDVAGLVLVGEGLPAGAGSARLTEAVGVREAEVDLFGYPGDPPRRDGAWARCRLGGVVGGGLIQLDADSEAVFRAQPGYSGSPAVVADGVGDAVVGMLAVATRDQDARDAYAIPVARLVDAWPQVLESVPLCPYRGLLPFRAEDAEAGLFVGREEEVARLRRMVGERAVVVVVGPSGVGKSSLVTAGLLPGMRGTGEWAGATFRPGRTPFFALAKALYDLEGPAPGLSTDAVDRRGAQIREEGLAGLAGKLSVLIGRRILLHADQFEEMLTTCPPGERAEFLDRVLPAGNVDDVPYRLACTLRADFLRPLLEHADVGPRLQDRLLLLSPMGVATLERAVSEPARVRGVSYDDGLARQIALDAAGGGGGLPLLEFALTELWARQRRRWLTFGDYHSLGGVEGALDRYAEGVFAELAQRGLGDRVRRVMLALVRSREGAAQATRRVVGRGLLARDWDVVEELARRRLLMIDEFVGDRRLVRDDG